MDLGLGNLIELKRRLLPSTLTSATTYDTAITAIGRGVAGLFDTHCNRKFARLAGAVDQFSADRMSWVLARFPLESVTGISTRDDINSTWVSYEPTELIVNQDEPSGLLQFGTILGSHLSQVRVTYTGGYWYDTAETEDTSLPSGATRVPYAIKEAWYLQCEAVWAAREKIGGNLAKAGGDSALATMEIIPVVKLMIEAHRRFQLT